MNPNSSALPASAADMFSAYAPPSGVYDELQATGGRSRPHCDTFITALRTMGVREFQRRWGQAQRLVHENGLAFSAYGDPADRPRPWELDPLPVLIPGSQWQQVSDALRQRALLLNLTLADLYGPQRLLQEKTLPPELVFSHPGFLRAYHGQHPRNESFLTFYAADIARAPNGDWWVLADRTEAPSGAGYALENRIVVSRMLPSVFHSCHVERLASYFAAVRETLFLAARTNRENPRVTLLSQGPQSANYFEDAYLARYLGYALVEADDLAVRGSRVMLKTLGGLLPVDVILRRPNSDACDPLELNSSSGAGVAGLLQSVRSDNAVVANSLGSGLVESPVFFAFMPSLCRKLLGEELKMPGVATWWCGNPDSLKYVLANLRRLTIKRAFRHRGREFHFGRGLAAMSLDKLAEAIRANPSAYVAQEQVVRSTAPIWKDEQLHPSYIAMRAFLVSSQGSYNVMQGGLVRVSESLDPLEMSILAGERSKDAWILADRPVQPISLLQQPGQAVELRRGGVELPSRVADNLYWLGRHMERADAAARLLRTVALRLSSESEATSIVELPTLLRVLAQQGQIEPGFVVEGMRDQLPRIEQALPSAVFDESQSGSLRTIVSGMFRTASIVRDRMSVDSWRILHRMDELFRPPLHGAAELGDVLPAINELIIDLAAFSGTVMESMTRTLGWRFLDLGRRLERALQIIALVRHTLAHSNNVQGPVLESVLQIAECLMTYRSRYLANLQLAATLDLLLTDETNPRSVVYQLVQIAEHVQRLPREQTQPLYASEQRLAMTSLHMLRMLDIQLLAEQHVLGEQQPLEQLLEELDTQLPKLSEVISHKYLIHVGPGRQLAEIRPECT
ncbi:MAG: circularly permuted type 2 ATP-grasp protein [Planctomycetales bacterium]|nr:circularly permuted type 2 ATP-grasp protein [Planctomycetales bacterium]